MKKYIYVMVGMAAMLLNLASCSEDDLDSRSIFEEGTTRKENEFDKWLKKSYTDTYNIKLLYRLEDMETDLEHVLAPADFVLSQKLAKIVKYAWLEAYDEVAGVDFTRSYVPKIIHMIGSPAYEENGTMILGTAEGGLKVTLYVVNSLTIEKAFLNEYYLKTMHHEFTHILNQTKNYDTDFERISEGLYVSGDWYLQSDKDVLPLGFITPYASSQPGEDYAEMVSMYVTLSPEEWEARMAVAGAEGGAIINQKLAMVKKYMSTEWNIDMEQLRNVVQRRVGDVVDGTLDLSPIATLE